MGCQLTLTVVIILLSGIVKGDITTDNLVYKGCYDLSYSLAMNYHEHLPSISLEGCINVCSSKSTRYVGIELSDDFCYCGNDIAENSNSREDSLCNVMCSDASTRTCGGDWLMSVYDTKERTTASPVRANNGSVSFLIGLSAGIRVYNETSLPDYQTVLATGDHGWAYTVDYHFAKRLVYANTKGKLIMGNVSQSFGALSTTPIFLRSLSLCDGFAVDWVQDRIYWADCANRRPPIISSMDLDGSNNEAVSSLSGNSRMVKRMEVDPYNSMLFWQSEGVIESLNITNKVFHTNLSVEGNVVRVLALDRSAQRIYYVGSEDEESALFSMDYRGKGHIKIFQATQLQSLFGLGVHGGFVYWVNYARSTDIIYKAPLKIGAGRNIATLQTVDKAVWHMRVVHSDIQATPVENVCSRKGCSHFCEEQSPDSAICHCPDGCPLASDGKSCEMRLSENETTITSYSNKSTKTSTISPFTTTTTDDPESTQLGDVKQVGCFAISYGPGRQYHYKMSNITLKSCFEKCVELNTPFAGIAAKDKNCYCGNDVLMSSPRVINFLCSDPCPDNPRLPCGGDWLMTVYDLTKMLPPRNESDVEIMEDNVNFLIGHSDSVKLYNISDLNRPQLLFENDRGWAYGVDYHYDKKLMFVSTRSALYKSTLFPKSTPETSSTLILNMTNCEAFAVDWVHDKIFWVDCSDSYFSLKVIDLDGRNSTTIIKKMHGGAIVKRMVIDPYVGMLFWINDGTIESSETNGANMHTNVSNPVITVRGLTLDISNQRLFYLGSLDSEAILYSADYEGNDLKSALRAPQISGVYGMGIVRGVVYWINYLSSDILYRAPLEQHSSTEIKVLKVFGIDSTVWHMKVVHPDHQKAPESDPCSSGSSSCLAQVKLDQKESVADELLLGMIVVGGVLVVVGLLMYLTDMKYWHMVRNKLTRVPYTRQGVGGPTTYDTTEDNVNLI